MSVFGTSAIDLSMCGNDGQQLTANVYMLEGVQNADGSLREMSIGQLVMAICLSRATELENQIVAKMESMSESSAVLEALTEVDSYIVENSKYADFTLSTAVTVTTTSGTKKTVTTANDLLDALGVTRTGDYSDVMSNVESEMDSLNSVSQTTLIDIQSLTSKRDDTYNLVSNVLKSLNTVMTGNVNNL